MMKVTVILLIEVNGLTERIEKKIDIETQKLGASVARSRVEDLNRWTRTQLDLIQEDI